MSLDHAIERLRNALQMHNENRTTMQSLASSVGDFLRDAATLRQQAGRADEGTARGLVRLWRQIEQSDEPQTEFDKGYEQASQECATALEAALSAQPAERQGEAVAWIDEFGNVYPLGAHSLNGKLSWQDAHKRNWRPLYLHPAAPVGVPDGMVLVGYAWPREADYEHIHRCYGKAGDDDELKRIPSGAVGVYANLAAAPSAPQGVE